MGNRFMFLRLKVSRTCRHGHVKNYIELIFMPFLWQSNPLPSQLSLQKHLELAL